MTAIETSGLTKSYRVGFWRKTEKVGLKNLTLEVNEGEVFGFLGPNGAGKTTTLKLLMGITFPTSGTMRILGKAVGDPEVKAQVGFLPEQPYFYDYLTAFELLNYYAQLSGVPQKGRKDRVMAMLDRVGMSEAANVQLRKFSKGMLQRVGIAQSIVHDPKVVFLDEPMSGLDPVGRREVRDLIQSLNDEGKTVFFSTHILADAEAICDRVAVLHKGELKGVGVVADLMKQHAHSTELVCEGKAAAAALKSALPSVECRVTGDTVRAVIPDDKNYTAIEAVRASGARLISVIPVRGSLEDFFMTRVEQVQVQEAKAKAKQ